MIRLILARNQVIVPVISRILVNVMHNLGWLQVTANRFLNDKASAFHAAATIASGMAGDTDTDFTAPSAIAASSM